MTTSKIRSAPWAFISNMFPSTRDVSYGAFVQRSHDDLVSQGFNIREVIVIRGRATGRRRMAAYAMHYLRLAGLLLKPQIRHLYVHYASHHCLLPAIGARFFGKQVLVNVHGDDLALGNSSLYRRIMKVGQSSLLRSARMIAVPSTFFKELLLSRIPEIDPARVVVSPSSGIDFDSLSAATAARQCFWQQDAASRIAEIGYIGRIDPDKGWEQLLAAFESLPETQRARSRLHFWGDGMETPRLQALIADRPAGQVFHHGAIPARELPRAHARFDFHAVPSQRESLGLAAIEGLGAGHVLLCSAIRPFTDMTRDGVSALHVDRPTPEAISATLSRALTLPDETLATLAANGQAVARTFDRKTVASELAGHIDRSFHE
jgi:glycosyltransferase involved in cell wall biosynthesis